MNNPYIHRSMLKSTEMFFGREEELGLICDLLEGRQSISIVGERRIGKSSLLYSLRLPEIWERVGRIFPTNYVYVYIDLSRHANRSPEAFFAYLLEKLQKSTNLCLIRSSNTEASIQVDYIDPNTGVLKQERLTQLRRILTNHFSERELNTLCFDLGIDYDSLPGEGKTDKARELISYLERRNLVLKLVQTGKCVRPDISWNTISRGQSEWLHREVDQDLFCDAILKFHAEEKVVVFLLDEFDSVTRNSHFSVDFFNFLRSLANTGRLVYVTVSKERLVNICHHSVVSSPFFNIFSTIPLGLMSNSAAKDLITIPSNSAQVPLAEDKEFVLKSAGRHPFLIQILCFYLLAQKLTGPSSYQKRALELFRPEVFDHFINLWGNLSEDDKALFREFALDPSLHPTPSPLLDSEVFRNFVIEHQEPKNPSNRLKRNETGKRNFKRKIVGVGIVLAIIILTVTAVYLDPIQAFQGIIFLIIPGLIGLLGIGELIRRKNKD
jgi:hypothetical protein